MADKSKVSQNCEHHKCNKKMANTKLHPAEQYAQRDSQQGTQKREENTLE